MNRLFTLIGAICLFISLASANTLTAKNTNGFSKMPAMECGIVGELLTHHISCRGADDGILILNMTGGTPPYIYTWSNGADESFDVLIELAPGDYSVTITDADNCTLEFSSTITEPDLFYANANTDNESAPSANDGSVTANPYGGTPPYAYLWSNNSTTAFVDNLAVGDYTVTVTDANDCISIQTVTVNPFGCSVTLVNTNAQISCFGECDGQAGALFGNGTAPYAINWSNGSQSSNISALCEGVYSVTVTDSNGCSNQNNVQIVEPYLLKLELVNLTNVGCFGDNSGSVTVQPKGGTPPFSYQWSNGASSGSTINNLPIGTYSATVTDGGGCSAFFTVEITQAPLLEIGIDNINPVDCSGAATGSAGVLATGGTGSYGFSWSNGAEGNTQVNLPAGNYTVTVNDGNNCTDEVSFTIAEPEPLALTVESKNNVSCFGANDGSVMVLASGGTAGYNFEWSDGASGNTVSGLAPGTYSLTVTDSNNCTEEVSVVITEPDVLSLSLQNLETVTCFGASDGSIEISSSGGTMPMTMNWSNGDTGAVINNLGPGNYVLTLTDANGCTEELAASITEPEALVLSATVTDVNCPESFQGSIAVVVTGGTGDYDYLWSNGSTVNPIFNLPGGNYSFTVTDANNCSESIEAEIASLDNENPVAVANDVSLFLSSNGTVFLLPVQVDSGSSDNCDIGSIALSQTEFDCSDIGENTVLFVVTDLTGNSASVEITVTITDVITPEIICPDNISVPGCEAALDYDLPAVVDNCFATGEPTLSAGFPPGATFPEGLTVVSYSYTDSENNTTLCSFVVTVTSSVMEIDYTVEDLICNGDSDGSISVNVSGGTPLYTYNWENGHTEPDIQGLSAGIYSLTVTDDDNCEEVLHIEILEPDPFVVTLEELVNEADGGGNGSIDITITGGSEDYTVEWYLNNEIISDTTDISGLSAGDYVLVITDVNDCIFTSDVFSIDNITGINDPDENLGFRLSPNPAGAVVNMLIDDNLTENAVISIWDVLGQKIMENNLIDNGSTEQQLDFSLYANGTYFVRLDCEKGNFIRKIVVSR